MDLVDGFNVVPSSSVSSPFTPPTHPVSSPYFSTPSSSSSSSRLYMSGEMGSNSNDDDGTGADVVADEFIQMIPIAFSMLAILGIKTVKDVINYPPMAFDRYMLQKDPSQQTSPIVMLCKLAGVLLFKTLHDATYYPLLWTKQFLLAGNCNNNNKECEL